MKSRLFVATAVVALMVNAAELGAQDVVNVPTGDRVLNPSLTELFTVGSMAGADWETFADVRSVAFDGAGNLYVLDADNHRVVVTDQGGAFLREMGKEGDGPGELRMPLGMVVSPEGQVAVMDMGHQAFVIYDAAGNYVRNARNDFQNGLMDMAVQYHPRGGAVGVRSNFSMGPGDAGPEGAPIRFVPFGEGAEIEDLITAWRPPVEVASGGGGNFSSSGGNISFSGGPKLRAFEPEVHAAVLADGRIAVVDSVTYSLKLVDPTGGIGALLSREIQARPVTSRDQKEEVDRRRREIEDAEATGGGGGGVMVLSTTSGGGGGDGGARSMSIGGDQIRDMQLQRLESMIFAEEVPVISNMAADKDGHIWVERTGDRVGEDGPTDIITAGGKYLGSIPADGVRIPRAFGPNGLVAFVETDDFDVEYVVVSRVEGIGNK
jgi:6-bladed beta-propeller